MFWNNYVKLCEQKGKTPNAVAAELGLSSGSVTAWKQGRLPRGGTIEMIARYFEVEPAYLLNDNEIRHTTPTTEDPLTEEIITYTKILARTEEGIKQLEAVASTLKRIAELEQLTAELEAKQPEPK